MEQTETERKKIGIKKLKIFFDLFSTKMRKRNVPHGTIF